MPDFYPDINEFLEITDNKWSIKPDGLEELIYRLCAYTGLEYDICSRLVCAYFKEIRNSMLRGEAVGLKNFGSFLMVSPKTGSSRQIFPKFKSSKEFSRKLNGK